VIDPIVRQATGADHEALIQLEAEARASLADQRGGQRWLQEHPERQWDAPAHTHDVVLLGQIDQVPIGYLVLTRDSPQVARVEQVYVTPGARGIGFGDELLASARECALALGVEYLEAEALPGDRETKNLYERAGITARSIIVSIRLER
jgi:GNAT superfamily N-acetyltransferase